MEAGEGWSFGSYAVSPDGSTIFYPRRDKAEEACRLLRRDLTSGAETELYRGPYEEPFTVALSPDGQTLATLNRHPNDAGAERVIRLLPAMGGTPRDILRFAPSTNAPIRPEFSADGKYLFLPWDTTPEDPASSLFRLPVQGGEPEDLGLKMIAFGRFSAHPDGRQLLFSSRGAEQKSTEVWVIEDFLPRTTTQKGGGS
jgi:hypothetical protein